MKRKRIWNLKQEVNNVPVENLNLQSPISKLLHMNPALDTSDKVSAFMNHNEYRNPQDLNDIDVAWTRLLKAKDNNEKVLVYGDYDMDGMTAASIMYEGLKTEGLNVSYVVPDRKLDGYGPSRRLYEDALNSGFSVIVTVDNGISGGPIIDEYAKKGLDVIITDHHEPNEQMIPKLATAKVHPMLSPNYGFNGISGAGVAFKFIMYRHPELETSLLPLAAMGTVADVMDLVDENRKIVYYGLVALSYTDRVGLIALKKAQNVDDSNITSDTIGFDLAPMLNSVGRLKNANVGVELLLTNDYQRAVEIVKMISELNNYRKQLVHDVTKEAFNQAQEQSKNHSILLVGGNGHKWHMGIVGIVAAKVAEEFHKPTLAMSFPEDDNFELHEIHGSGRSIPGFNLYEALASTQDLFESVGGHAGAAGFGVYARNLEPLQVKLDMYVNEHPLPVKVPALDISESLDLSQITFDFYQDLQKLAPFGAGNPEPLFHVHFDYISDIFQMGGSKQHVKFVGHQGDKSITVIGFFVGKDYDALKFVSDNQQSIDVAGKLSVNVFRNQTSLQILASDWGNEFAY